MFELQVGDVLARYGIDADLAEVRLVGNAGGWSGSRLWRVKDGGGRELCLRRWPEGYLVERLKWIHAVLGAVAVEMPIVASPLRTSTGTTFVEQGELLWDVAEWKPGLADYRTNANRLRLRGAMQALGRFH